MRKIGLTHAIIFLCLLVFALNTHRTAAQKDGLLRVYMLNVGQGDAILIEAPNGNQILIDGGPDGKVLGELSRVMPFYDRTLDAVMLTHGDADHVSGLVDVLERYEVSTIIQTPVQTGTSVFDAWQHGVAMEEARVVYAAAGQIIDAGNGVQIRILFPFSELPAQETKSANDFSIIALLVYKDFELLLTGDIEEKGERQLILNGVSIDADILKVGHHGSKTSTSPAFLEKVAPDVALISLGLNNRYGHPHPSVIERLEKSAIPYYRTDVHGAITVVTDGEQYQIITEQ